MTSAAATAPTAAKTPVFRRTSFWKRYSVLGGRAWVSVNKAVVTQASAAIPVVPLYLSLLSKVLRAKGLDEDPIRQMRRLFADFLVGDLPDLFHLEPAQIVGGADLVEKRRFTEFGHSDIPILHVGKSRPT